MNSNKNETEIYTYTYNEVFQGITHLDLTQLSDNNFNSLSNNYIEPLKDNLGNKDLYQYANRTLFNNKTSNIKNSLNLYTIKTNKGSICHHFRPNVYYFSVGDMYFTKPVYTSGYYLGKDIEIIYDVLPDKTRQITVVFL